jgi:hypothetical protein
LLRVTQSSPRRCRIPEIATSERSRRPGPIQTVSGTVQEYGVAIAGRRVDVYDRHTGELIGTTVSASDGTWSVNCLGRVTVRVVCSDPFTFDSMVFDNVVPMT